MQSHSLQDPELTNLCSNPTQFSKDYDYNLSHQSCTRRLLFSHVISNLFSIHRTISQRCEEDQKNQLKLQQCPNIKLEDNSIDLGKDFAQQFSKALLQRNATQIQAKVLLNFIIKHHKWHILAILLFMAGQVIFKLTLAIIFKHLFNTVSVIEQGNNKSICYLYAFICGTLLLCITISRQNANLQIAILIGRIRSELALLIFLKISKLSQFVIKQSQETGKIINLLSSDFNVIEAESQFFFQFLVSPIAIIGTLIVAVDGFGYRALIIAFLLTLFVIMQVLLGKMNAYYLKQSNVYKDKRVKTSAECIEMIKPIKMFGLQIKFYKMIEALRKKQVKDYFIMSFGKSLERAFGNTIGYFSTFTFFLWTELAGEGGSLSYPKMFAIIQLVDANKYTFTSMGNSLSLYFMLEVILDRTCKILNIQEKRMIKIDQPPGQRTNKQFPKQESQAEQSTSLKVGEIVFDKFTGFWQKQQPATPIISVDFKIDPCQFIAVIGKVGSGKSALLQALIEEIPYYSGTISKKGTIVYAQQQPILFSGTIRDNIIFGQPFQQAKYRKVISMSCLDRDLQIFQQRDFMVLQEKGSNLSGGQRARVSLARSLYFDSDILLLDDPIAAVDAKVANQINQNIITNLKGKKTIIFVTHRASLLNQCDAFIVIDHGRAEKINNLSQLKDKIEQIEGPQGRKYSLDSNENNSIFDCEDQQHQQKQTEQTQQESKKVELKQPKQRQAVAVTLHSYAKYFFSSKLNYLFFPLCILFFVATEIVNVAYIRTLSLHSQVKDGESTQFQSMSSYWTILAILQLSFFVFNFLKYFFIKIVIFCSNQSIHDKAIRRIMRISCLYFDTHSPSILLNKLSNDMSVIDNLTFLSFLGTIEGLIGTIILLANVIAIDKLYLLPGLMNILFSTFFFFKYNNSLVMAKNLDLITKTPIFIAVKQMTQGLIQIRVFKRRMELIEQFSKKLDNMLRANLNFWNINRGYIAVLFCSSIFTVWISLFVGIYVVTPQNQALYGVCIIFFMEINQHYYFFLRQVSASDSSIVSSERIQSILQLETQRQLYTSYDKQKLGQNQEGKNNQQSAEIQEFQKGNTHPYIQTNQKQVELPLKSYRNEKAQQLNINQTETVISLQNFSLKYRPELANALNQLQLSVFEHQKVAIVGRTGAGKSSIVQALFRMYQPQPGSQYRIEGLDALRMGLHTLRTKISVIPQTPFIFRGTIRQNIDIFGTKSDGQILDCLQKTNLKSTIEKLPNGLQADIQAIMSTGQKQLLCLARALLNKSKVLVMDEPTSSIDPQTNKLIQSCIRTNFQKTTIITIAHQLTTVADYNSIVVMDRGMAVQYGSPYTLLKKRGIFYEMVLKSGSSSTEISKIAMESAIKRSRNI